MNDPHFVINAFFSEPHLVQIIVEQLASDCIDFGRSDTKTPCGWKAIDTSSIESFATVDLDIRSDKIWKKLPVTNCFVFTCNKFKGTGYQLTWIRSLS